MSEGTGDADEQDKPLLARRSDPASVLFPILQSLCTGNGRGNAGAGELCARLGSRPGRLPVPSAGAGNGRYCQTGRELLRRFSYLFPYASAPGTIRQGPVYPKRGSSFSFARASPATGRSRLGGRGTRQ